MLFSSLIVDHAHWHSTILILTWLVLIMLQDVPIRGILVLKTLTHVAQDDLPFGGIGASGMGKYHGKEGFFSFSHERSMMSNPVSPKLYSLNSFYHRTTNQHINCF